MDSVPSHMNLIHVLLPYTLRSILILFFHLCLHHPGGPFPSGFLIGYVCVLFISFMRAAYRTDIILFDLFTSVYGETYGAPRYGDFSNC
jgi:hypothetical protein